MNAETQLGPQLARVAQSANPDRTWLLTGVLALACALWVLIAFGDTVAAAAGTWLRSETYAHGLLVVPIAAYLLWRERHAVAELPAHPNVFGLLIFAAAGALWLLGRLAIVEAAQQFAVVIMLVSGAWALLGTQIVRRLWFPLLFLVFAVPFGDFLLPPLMNFTADFTVAALRLTGIPVYREGHLFQIPSGSWSVVEACSGLRYLIASITLGALYGYLSYRSPWKRIAFILFSIAAPILANGLRAYIIVMIGHLSKMTLAVGIDHLIYGWIFFGLVMMLMFWVGSLWRDPPLDEAAAPALAQQPASKLPMSLPVMALALGLIAALWPAYAQQLARQHVKANVFLSTPRTAGDWLLTETAPNQWAPYYRFARSELTHTYAKSEREVSVHLKYYRRQSQGAEMINSFNSLAGSSSPWRARASRSVDVRLGTKQVRVIESELGAMGRQVLVWHWYEIGNRHTSSDAVAKLLQAKLRVQRGSDDSAAIFLSTPVREDGPPARTVLADFAAQMWPSIDETLRRAKP